MLLLKRSSHFSADCPPNHRSWHIRLILAFVTNTGSIRNERRNKLMQSAWHQRAAERGGWKRWKEKMKRSSSQGGACLTGPWCHPETQASVQRARERDRVWPLHSNGQDVWTQLSTSLELHFLHCQHVKVDLQYWLRQNIWKAVCWTR